MSDSDSSPSRSASDRIRLNVGGRLFETTVSTLRAVPGSFLDALVSDRWSLDNSHTVFIDRDGEHFRSILNFLRDGDMCLPRDKRALAELMREAEFYGLDALLERVVDKSHDYQLFFEDDIVEWKYRDIDSLWRAFDQDPTPLATLLQYKETCPNCCTPRPNDLSAQRWRHLLAMDRKRVGCVLRAECHVLKVFANSGRMCATVSYSEKSGTPSILYFHLPTFLLTLKQH